MRMTGRRRPLAAAAVVLAACSAPAPAPTPSSTAAAAPALVGTWDGDDRTTFVFREGGAAEWTLPISTPPSTFAVRYRYDAAVSPAHLDISGFTQPPLSGRTLYCIVEPAGADAFRMDCEPGTDASARPAALDPAQTRSYRRRP